MTMGQLAGRLAGGFTRPIDPEALQDAVRAALAITSLGELDSIKNLPGMARAAVGTLDKVWRAGIDLARASNPRLAALHALEQAVLRRLPPAMRRPKELVELACGRIGHARAAQGPIEVNGHSEMAPCWRPLLAALATAVPVAWVAGPRPVPAWVRVMKLEIRSEQPSAAEPELISCAHPQHEVLEAFRWIRKLLAGGGAKPEDIAIVAANPADFDDQVLALSRDANLAVHFVHGIKAVTTRDGQAAAALAEVLVKGISQERIRRLFALLHDRSQATAGLPQDWARVLPKDAPLITFKTLSRRVAHGGFRAKRRSTHPTRDHTRSVGRGFRLPRALIKRSWRNNDYGYGSIKYSRCLGGFCWRNMPARSLAFAYSSLYVKTPSGSSSSN